jgi:SAM-dependent methyltransferase
VPVSATLIGAAVLRQVPAAQDLADTLPRVSDHETRRLSFGSVAADYARYRPGPPPQALDWLIPAGAQAVLDLAAGTGAVTRELAGRAPRVIAVEPDERMRAILTASCPWAEVLAGRGEDIPLPDASVDAVVISAAWHWLDPDRPCRRSPACCAWAVCWA